MGMGRGNDCKHHHLAIGGHCYALKKVLGLSKEHDSHSKVNSSLLPIVLRFDFSDWSIGYL